MGDRYPKFKAASVQASPVFLNREATVEKACNLMKEASRNDAKLVAFPETFVPGYPYWVWMDSPPNNYNFFKMLFKESVEIPSKATDELCRGAREADIYVVIGVNEKSSSQMGTMWNTNLIIDNNGKILGKHRKLVPTFAEKLVHSFGDGSGLKVWDTDIGKLGTLACGNNTHSLYKYALIAQGEQVHVANYPAFSLGADCDLPNWIRIRSGAHCLEGKLFTITSSSTVSSEMLEILCGNDEKKIKWLSGCRAYSCIHNPLGDELVGAENTEGILYSDINVEEEIAAKQFHDIIGHYTRSDAVSLNLCRDENRPLWFSTRTNMKTLDQGNIEYENNSKIIEKLDYLTNCLESTIAESK